MVNKRGRPKGTLTGRTRTCRNLSLDKILYSKIEIMSEVENTPISRLMDEALELLIKSYEKGE